MFVFYFGLIADVSPPVGLAAYAAAAIAGADPMRVGWQGSWYELRTLLLEVRHLGHRLAEIVNGEIGKARPVGDQDEVRSGDNRRDGDGGLDEALLPGAPAR